jgi:hypothetical protein
MIITLNIETRRFYNLDRHERVCSMCNLNVVEDEYHFILQCEKYIDVRYICKTIIRNEMKLSVANFFS